jgi:hypothetical protein
MYPFHCTSQSSCAMGSLGNSSFPIHYETARTGRKEKEKQVTIVEPNRKDDMVNTSMNMNSNIKNTIIGPNNEIRTKHDAALKHQAKE